MVASIASAAAAQEPFDVVVTECMGQLEVGEPECICVAKRVAVELSERQMAYLAVRIAGNDAEVTRMREFMGFFERIVIVGIVATTVEDCTDGAVTELPF